MPSKRLSQVIWLSSNHRALIYSTLQKLKKNKALTSFSHYIVNDYRSFSWEQLVEVRSPASLFSQDNHFVLLDLPDSDEKPLPAKGIKVVDDWLQMGEDATLLVIRSPVFNFRVNKSSWFLRYVKNGVIRELKMDYARSIDWIIEQAGYRQVVLSREQANILYEKHVGDIDVIANEIEILALSPLTPINSKHQSGNYSLQQFIQALSALDFNMAIKMIYRFREQGLLPIEIFWQISNFVNLNYRAQKGLGYLPRNFSRYQGGPLVSRFLGLVSVESAIKGITPISPWFALIEYCKVLCQKR